MPMFVDTSRVPVTAEGEIDHKDISPDVDTMFIRKKMDYETSQKVVGAATKFKPGDKGKAEEDETQIDIGAWNLALMQFNILAWQGPSFKGVPCNKKTIAALDPDEPLVKMVMECISARNLSEGKADPKSSTDTGDES